MPDAIHEANRLVYAYGIPINTVLIYGVLLSLRFVSFAAEFVEAQRSDGERMWAYNNQILSLDLENMIKSDVVDGSTYIFQIAIYDSWLLI